MTSASPHPLREATKAAHQVVDRYLTAVRRRLALRWVLVGVLAAGFAGVGLVLAWLGGGLGAPDGTPALGWQLLQVCASLFGVALLVAMIRWLGRSPRPVIRRLRRVEPALAEDLRSALQLRSRSEKPTAEGAFVRCHADRVAQELSVVPARLLVPQRRLAHAAWMLCLAGALTAAAVLTLPGAGRRLLSALGAQGGTDRLPRVLRGPGVHNVRFVVHPPRYTGLELQVLAWRRAPLSVITGARVTVVAKVADEVGALESAAVSLPGGEVVEATLLGERIFRVTFVASKPGSLAFVYRSVQGVRYVGEAGPQLLLRPDLPPDLSVQPADAQITLPKARKLPLRFDVTDDYGLTELRLTWRTDGGDQGAVVLGRGPRFGPGRKRALRSTYLWDLTRLGLRSGESVRFRLEATDNRSPVAGGPQRRHTPWQTVTLSATPTARLEALSRLRALLERSVLRLADRLEHDRKKGCETQLKRWDGARAREKKLVADAAKLIAQVKKRAQLPALLKAAVAGPLSKALGELRRAVGRDAARAGGQGEACRRVRRLAESHRGVIRGLEGWVLALDRLIGRATLEQMQALGRRIARLQKEIARLQAALKKNPSAELRRRIARRMQRLQRLFDRLGKLWSSLQDDSLDQHVNRYALDRRRTGKLLDGLAQKLRRGQSTDADMQQLRRRVEQMQKALQQGLDSFRKYYPLPGERGLQRDVQTLRRLADAQGRLNQQRRAQPGQARQGQKRLARETDRVGRGLGRRPGGSEAARLLKEAAELMRQAADARGKKADAKGRAAKDALDQAARKLGRQGRLSRDDGEDDGRGQSTRDVDIPPAGGALPRKLRQRILEGGRTAWPEGYQSPLKRYYERLLR